MSHSDKQDVVTVNGCHDCPFRQGKTCHFVGFVTHIESVMSKINVFVNGQRKGWIAVSVDNSKIGWVFNHPTWGLIILSRKTGKDYFF